MKNRITILFFSLFLAVFLNSCGSESTTNETETKNTSTESNTEQSEAIKAQAKHYKIEDASGKQFAEIMINGKNIELKVGETHYKSKLKGVKRKYQSREGGIVAEVKYKGDESFKLRTPDAELKWKIKFYDDKFKVSEAGAANSFQHDGVATEKIEKSA